MLLAVLAHIEGDHGGLVVEQELGERLGQLGLADAGGPGEDERTGGTLRILQAGSGEQVGAVADAFRTDVGAVRDEVTVGICGGLGLPVQPASLDVV